MGGGLMQLVAYGAQDIYLTGNPQITFFKVVYRRHTNFSMEAIEQTFNGSADFGKRVTCTVSRNGDLMHRVYLQVTVPAVTAGAGGFRWLNWLGHVLIKNVEVEIGGQRIDKHYGDWMHIWNELTQSPGHKVGYANMVGNVPRLTQLTPADAKTPEVDLYIPLEFWFCRNPGLSLPLIALQYHEVKINLEFRSASECYFGAAVSVPSLEAASLYVDYIYLDTEERRRFAQMSHEYLIDQLQFTGAESVTTNATQSIRLNFNHPVKELVWVFRTALNEGNNDYLNFYSAVESIVEPMVNAKVMLNGHDRASQRDASYYRLMQPWQHHSNVPLKPVYVYSFALRPEEHQPSGTCNFSRIDNATLKVTNNAIVDGSIFVFAVNYNVLRVVSGMGGLAYSN